MADLNKVMLIGRLGKDPERKTMQDGKEYSRFSLATSRGPRDKEVTQWHNVTVWAEQAAKFINEYGRAGSLVYVEGEIEYRQYDKGGVTMYATNIIVPDFRGSVSILKDSTARSDDRGGTSRARGTPAGYAEQSGGRSPPPKDLRDDLEDEIPF